MIHKIQVTIIILLIPFSIFYFYTKSQGVSMTEVFNVSTPVLHIGEIPLRVEIADTDATREKGLSGRKEFPDVNGILFIFDKPDYHGIWMKDMNFPIDVIWIDENLTVVGITTGLTPESYPDTYRPPTRIKYVVETDTHFADTFGIGVGNKVSLPLGYRPN